MINIVKRAISDDERRFIQEVASLLATWGMPGSAGRVFGYLLLKQSPVSLDQIATDLEMSKVGSWNAARLLERFGHARRYGEPGSKRALYGASDNFGSPLQEQGSLLGALGTLLQNGASTVATGEAAVRLAERGRFYLFLRRAMEAAIQDFNASRSGEPVELDGADTSAMTRRGA